VSNLAQMLPGAKYQYILVNDSDIRVQPDYLRRVTAPLAEPQTGLVTCLYRGVPGRTLGSRLESLGISADFFRCGAGRARPRRRHPLWPCSTLAFRRSDLESAGGFEALMDYLADDYEIGRRIGERGLKIKLSAVVVETYLPAYTLRQFVDHQLRWGRTVRDSRRWGYLGLVLTFGIPGLCWRCHCADTGPGGARGLDFAGCDYHLRVAVALLVGTVCLVRSQGAATASAASSRDLVALLIWMLVSPATGGMARRFLHAQGANWFASTRESST